MRRLVLTVHEVAEALGCSPKTVYKMIRLGQLGSVRLGSKVAVPVKVLDEYLGRAS